MSEEGFFAFFCFWVWVVPLLQSERQKIIQIQRNRISNLEKQLSRKNREIQRLKLGRWLSPKRSPQPSLKFLRKLMLEGHWAKALQTSFDLRRDHPRWAELSSLRVQIFKKNGIK